MNDVIDSPNTSRSPSGVANSKDNSRDFDSNIIQQQQLIQQQTASARLSLTSNESTQSVIQPGSPKRPKSQRNSTGIMLPGSTTGETSGNESKPAVRKSQRTNTASNVPSNAPVAARVGAGSRRENFKKVGKRSSANSLPASADESDQQYPQQGNNGGQQPSGLMKTVGLAPGINSASDGEEGSFQQTAVVKRSSQTSVVGLKRASQNSMVGGNQSQYDQNNITGNIIGRVSSNSYLGVGQDNNLGQHMDMNTMEDYEVLDLTVNETLDVIIECKWRRLAMISIFMVAVALSRLFIGLAYFLPVRI